MRQRRRGSQHAPLVTAELEVATGVHRVNPTHRSRDRLQPMSHLAPYLDRSTRRPASASARGTPRPPLVDHVLDERARARPRRAAPHARRPARARPGLWRRSLPRSPPPNGYGAGSGRCPTVACTASTSTLPRSPRPAPRWDGRGRRPCRRRPRRRRPTGAVRRRGRQPAVPEPAGRAPRAAAADPRWGGGPYADTAALFLALGVRARPARRRPGRAGAAALDPGDARHRADPARGPGSVPASTPCGGPASGCSTPTCSPASPRSCAVRRNAIGAADVRAGVRAAPRRRRRRSGRAPDLEPPRGRRRRHPGGAPRPGAATFDDLAAATADFRDQYYGLVGHVVRRRRRAATGHVRAHRRRARAAWGRSPGALRPAHPSTHPRVDVAALAPALRTWAGSRLVPKVLVATQTRVIEAAVDPTRRVAPVGAGHHRGAPRAGRPVAGRGGAVRAGGDGVGGGDLSRRGAVSRRHQAQRVAAADAAAARPRPGTTPPRPSAAATSTAAPA